MEEIVEMKREERKKKRLGGLSLRKGKAKEALVGVGARVLFYPTLLYNVVRCRLQAEFHWWDEVDQYILLGAVPFRKHVPLLQQLGVHGVVTLNEPFETLIPSSMYQSLGIDHLILPTRDYMFAPSLEDISQAVEFIHNNVVSGKTTYVHCKAGRGRSTTVVICYLVKYKNMIPAAAFEYVRSKRPRVLLAPSQQKVVEEFWTQNMGPSHSGRAFPTSPADDAVIIATRDSDGYGACEVSFSSPKSSRRRPVNAMLSCLCASLRSATQPVPET